MGSRWPGESSSGYVLKGSQIGDLAQAVREAAAGRRYLSSPLSDLAIQSYLQKAQSADFKPPGAIATS